MAQVVRPYRGVSADERRATRRAGLVEAGLDVLGSEGLANTTMTAVCARAGLTERYFYESFRDRDQLLIAIFDAFTEEATEAMLAALGAAPPDLYERCRATAGAMIEVLTTDTRKARAYTEASGSELLKQRRAEIVRVYATLLAGQMRELHGLTAPRHQARLQLATTVILGGMAEAVADWLEGRLPLSRDELVDECAYLCVGAADAVKNASARRA